MIPNCDSSSPPFPPSAGWCVRRCATRGTRPMKCCTSKYRLIFGPTSMNGAKSSVSQRNSIFSSVESKHTLLRDINQSYWWDEECRLRTEEWNKNKRHLHAFLIKVRLCAATNRSIAQLKNKEHRNDISLISVRSSKSLWSKLSKKAVKAPQSVSSREPANLRAPSWELPCVCVEG